MVACFACAAVARPGTAREDDVKALLVLRLAKYVTWPAADVPRGALRVCAVGAGMAAALDRAAAGDSDVVVRPVAGDTGDLLACDVAVFGDGADIDVHYALVRLAGQPVLTVGGTDTFARDGGMIALVTRDRHVTFVVNLGAARRGGLQISSRLLQIATLVDGGTP